MNGTDENVTHQDDELIVSTPMWLKALVAILSIAIVGMLGLILYKIISGVGETPDAPEQPEQTEQPPQLTTAPFATVATGEFNIVRPQNMDLIAVIPAGTVVYLHFRSNDNAEQIIIFNRQTGDQSILRIVTSEE